MIIFIKNDNCKIIYDVLQYMVDWYQYNYTEIMRKKGDFL